MTASAGGPTTPTLLVGPGRILVGRYEIDRTLGSGGMSVVWLARDRMLNRDVAVKILRDEYATDPVFLARFTAEALHVAGLSHPGLVTIFDAGVDQGTAFIVMEVVHGRTLQEVLRDEGPLAVRRAVLVAADVCDVLDVAHRAGIVHRDIKPGNILISDDGRTRIFDFGIARTVGSPALTQTATVIGTAAYLSPEQAAGGPAVPQSDLYSVGCVLEETLTGAPPFTSETQVATLYQHIHGTPPAPSSRRPEVEGNLDAIVLRLLAKNPRDRPASAAEASRELLAVAPRSAGDTRVLPTFTPATSHRRYGRVRALAVAVACLLAVASAGALLVNGPERGTSAAAGSTSPTSSIPPSRNVSTPSPSVRTPSTALPSAAAIAPLVVPHATSAVGALAAFRTVVLAARRTSLLDAQSATRLLTSADDVAKALDKGTGKDKGDNHGPGNNHGPGKDGKGKGNSAVPQSRRLADLVTDLVRHGQVRPAAEAPLQQAANQLLRLVTDSS